MNYYYPMPPYYPYQNGYQMPNQDNQSDESSYKIGRASCRERV